MMQQGIIPGKQNLSGGEKIESEWVSVPKVTSR